MSLKLLGAVVACAAFGGFASLPVAAADAAHSIPGVRVTVPLESGWRFKQSSGLTGVETAAFDDSSWSQVEVPHTWNRIGNEGLERSPLSNSVQGTGWYRLRFKAPAVTGMRGSRYFVQFDGVGTVADAWLNGHYLGKHEGAFARFRFDATDAMNSSGDNLLVVKADNSRPQPGATTENVIPLSGDFFMFGGLYRSVALIVTGAAHVDMLDFGGPGLYAHVLRVDPATATVQVSARLVDATRVPRTVFVETNILDASDRIVARSSTRITTKPAMPAMAVTAFQAKLSIPSPRLWQGVKDPYLYETELTLRSVKGEILDRVRQPLGLRTVKLDPDKGFFLNGQHLFLRGASMHQDRPVKGWAISRADQEQDFDVLADMGGNAVRLAHYQHDQYSYELADTRGIVVWAETPLVNKVSYDGTPAGAALSANARQQLIELIRQNSNHPSVAFWSVGNEIDLTATQIKGPSQPGSLIKSLVALAKTEDPTRPTTFADCCETSLPPHVGADLDGTAPREAIVGLADSVGYNRYFGWYVGKSSDFGPMLDQAHARHPRLPISVSEYGAGAALTQHTDDPGGGPINPHGRPHPEELQDLYHETSWPLLRERTYLWGAFIWNLFDFSSDSRKEGDLTDINEKGLVSFDRQIRKDAFYFYRANWNPEPTLHLVGRRYVDRAYPVLDVKAYSNASSAALKLNGTDVGSAACAGGICLWRAVHLQKGANQLQATAVVGDKSVSDSLEWSFAGSPRVVRIKAGDISGYVTPDARRYGSDSYFTGGTGSGVNPPDTPADKQVAVSGPDPRLFDSFREGEFAYRVPVPNGRYEVTLGFEEPAAAAAGERLFSVDVNGATVLKHFDIFAAAGGKLKTVERSIKAKVTDGVLVISFRPTRGKALVSAVSITPRE